MIPESRRKAIKEEHQQWRDRIAQVNPTVTPVIDRFYFRSIYSGDRSLLLPLDLLP